MAALISSKVWFLFIALTVQYNTITLFKEGSAITCYSFLTYGPQKKKNRQPDNGFVGIRGLSFERLCTLFSHEC